MASPATETKQLKVECDETALNLFYRCCMPALVTGIQMLDSVGIIAYQQTQVLGIVSTVISDLSAFVIGIVDLFMTDTLKRIFP